MLSVSFSLFFLFLTAFAQYPYANQSSFFNLVLISDNTTYNGSLLTTCHTGAAMEALCVDTNPPANLSSAQYALFQFNTTGNDNTGVLTWVLQGGNFNLSSPMSFGTSATSNVAEALFSPGDGYPVAFDSEGLMNVQGDVDDTVYPPVIQTMAYYRWYACNTYYTGYQYLALVWVIGSGRPENPTCVKVDVVRVFAPIASSAHR